MFYTTPHLVFPQMHGRAGMGAWGIPDSWVTSFQYVNEHVVHRSTFINKHTCLQNYSSELRAKVHGNGATSDNNFGTIVLGNMSSFFILKDSSILSEMTLIEAYFCKKIFMLWENICWRSSYGTSLPARYH